MVEIDSMILKFKINITKNEISNVENNFIISESIETAKDLSSLEYLPQM